VLSCVYIVVTNRKVYKEEIIGINMEKLEVCAVDHYDPTIRVGSPCRVNETKYLVNLDGRGVFFQNEMSFQEVLSLTRAGKKLTNRPTSMYVVKDKEDGNTIINENYRSLSVNELESFNCSPEEIEERRNWGIPRK
jgi:hypothetical protein